MTGALIRHVRNLVPLPVRCRTAAWLTRQRWLKLDDHIAMGMVRDLQASDPKAFHKFAWSHHLMAYARWYDSEEELFAAEQMQSSRIELFADLISVLDDGLAIDRSSVQSVLEVGCSQGYLLRHLEVETLPACRTLLGIDIDALAVAKGARHLQRVGSRVELRHGDMEHLEALVGERMFDVTLAAGVLSYLNQADAARVVGMLLRRTRTLLVLAGLACIERPNSSLEQSVAPSSHPGQWIHNFEALIAGAGGRVVRSRWEGAKLYNLQTLCFAFAVPGEPQP